MSSHLNRRVKKWISRGTRSICLLGVGLMFAVGCVHRTNDVGYALASESSARQVTGRLFFRERLIPRPDTVAEVLLLEVSRADAPSRTIAEETINDISASPIPFVLEYDSARIDERMSYAVRATIRRNGRLLFTSDTHYPVITRGAANTVDLMLKRVSGSVTRPNASLTNTYWKLAFVNGRAYRHEGSQREPHLKLVADGNVVSGYGGCNNFTGTFEAKDGMLKFFDLAMTQRACLRGMEIEAEFTGALGKANRYSIRGDTLNLMQDDEIVLAFEAVYF